MLPGVEHEQRARALPDVVLVVVDLRDVEPLPERLPRESAPPRALHRDRRLGELTAEAVEGPEVLVDGGRELAVGLVAAVGRQVLPEERVEHVPRKVERELLLQAGDRLEVVAVTRSLELVERGVDALHVRGVVLVVVELEHLGRVGGLERAVVVLELGERVLHRILASAAELLPTTPVDRTQGRERWKRRFDVGSPVAGLLDVSRCRRRWRIERGQHVRVLGRGDGAVPEHDGPSRPAGRADERGYGQHVVWIGRSFEPAHPLDADPRRARSVPTRRALELSVGARDELAPVAVSLEGAEHVGDRRRVASHALERVALRGVRFRLKLVHGGTSLVVRPDRPA